MRTLIIQKRFHANSIGLVQALKKYGHEVRMIVHIKSSTSTTEDHSILDPIHVPYYGLFEKLHGFFYGKTINRFAIPCIGRIVREIRSFRPDIVVLKKSRMPNLVISAILKIFGIKRVLLTNSPPASEPMWLGKLFKTIGVLPKDRICTTISNSSPIKDGWVYGVRFIPYPIETFSVGNRSVKTGEMIKILCVCSLNSKRKRPWWVIEAVHRAGIGNQVEMTFVGVGSKDSWGAKRIQECAENYDLIDQVKTHYNIPHPEMQKIYTEQNILVHPALSEPFGMVVLEAMAGGLAVVCSDETGAKSCFRDGESGLVFPAQSLDKLAEHLRTLCLKPELIAKIGNQAQRTVAQHYSGEAFIGHLESLVEHH